MNIIHKKDEDLTGGATAPLTKGERSLAKGVSGVFALQFKEAKARDIVNNMKFDWVASEEWADQIYRVSHGLLAIEAEKVGGLSLNQVSVQSVDFVNTEEVQHVLQNNTFAFAKETGKSTQRSLGKSLTAGVKAGEDMRALTKRVQAVFGFVDPKTGKPVDPARALSWRSQRIARTEVARAQVLGMEQGWLQSGVVEAKVWDATGDACPFCLEMHGKVVDLGQPYFSEGDELTVPFQDRNITLPFRYGRIDGPPLHPNCRCTLQPEIIELNE